MWDFFDKMYSNIRKEEIKKAKLKLKNINTNTILQCITKECWNNNIQYNVIFKSSPFLIVELTGIREKIFIGYHKTTSVGVNNLKRFIRFMEQQGVSKGVYISTGVFNDKTYKYLEQCHFQKNIQLEDNFSFIKKQLGLTVSCKNAFKSNEIKFYKYLPS